MLACGLPGSRRAVRLCRSVRTVLYGTPQSTAGRQTGHQGRRPSVVTGIVLARATGYQRRYDETRLEETLEDEDRLLLVADVAGQVVAFSESVVSAANTGTLLWLHVDPSYRGEGIADGLFEKTREQLDSLGATTLRGRVLAENTEGNSFYEDREFTKAGTESVEIDGRNYVENIYTESKQWGSEAVETGDGRTVYVDHDNHERGSVAPFHVVFSDTDEETRYGYFCSNCNPLANAMDSMGRIECDSCGNVRKPVRWDAAYM